MGVRLRRGANAMEFALSLPWALLLIVATADFAMWTLTHHAVSRSVQDAAQVGARVTQGDGQDDGTEIKAEAVATTEKALQNWGTFPNGTVVTATWKPDDADMMWLTVHATVPYEALMGVISPFNRPVERTFVVLTQEQLAP